MCDQLPDIPPEVLPHQLEVVSGWALEFSRLIVTGDLSVHDDNPASSQAADLVSSMVILGLA